jgi:hypothetical protein
VKGVVCAMWETAPSLTIRCSMVNGLGRQHLVLATPTGRTRLTATVELKQGVGVNDASCQLARRRKEITRSPKKPKRKTDQLFVGRDYLDVVVQHYIRCGLAAGRPPPMALVEVAEAIEAADWKDRGLDVAAETGRLFAELGVEASSEVAIATSLKRSGRWLAHDPAMQCWLASELASWAVVKSIPMLKPDRTMDRMLEKLLSGQREAWAERLLLLALWMRADTESTFPAERWQDCVVLAHELLAGRELAELPAMASITERSRFKFPPISG